MPLNRGSLPRTHFLNVDLDVYSRTDLSPLVAALGKKVDVLFAGRDRRMHVAHLEVGRRTKDADTTLRAFCRLIKTLRPTGRKIWDGAAKRSFSIGILAGLQPNPCDFRIRAETVRAIAELDAEIVITVYPME